MLYDSTLWAHSCQPLPRQGHARGVTQEDKLPSASGGSGASRPMHQPLEPTSFAIKKTLEGVSVGGRSKLTQPNTQCVRIGQPDNAQGFFGSMTSPRST